MVQELFFLRVQGVRRLQRFTPGADLLGKCFCLCGFFFFLTFQRLLPGGCIRERTAQRIQLGGVPGQGVQLRAYTLLLGLLVQDAFPLRFGAGEAAQGLLQSFQCRCLPALALQGILQRRLLLRNAALQRIVGSLGLFQLFVPGHLRIQRRDFLTKGLLLGKGIPLLLQIFCCGLLRCGHGLPALLGLGQLLPGTLDLLGLAQKRMDLGQRRIPIGDSPVRLLGIGLVLGQKALNERHGLHKGKISLLGLLQRIFQWVLRLGENALDVLLHAGARGGAGVPQSAGFRFQPLLQDHVAAGVEQLPEDLLAGLGVCQQQLEKVALGDHGHLGKLAAAQTQDLGNGGGDLPGFGDDAAVRQMQLRLRFLDGGAAAAPGGALILRTAPDGVARLAAGEYQLHGGGRFRGGVFGAEHGRVPDIAAGLTVERVGNGVEQGGLSRAGIAGDEVKAAAAQRFQRDLRFVGVRAKGPHGQFQRSHTSSSQIRSISPRRNSRWASLMGCPFCPS